MKKIIVVATMLMSILSLAGTKEDFEAAIKNFQASNNQDISSFEKSLEKISNQKSDKYTRQANLTLLSLKLQQNKLADAQVYANKIINDKSADNEVKEQAYLALYKIYDIDINKRIETIEKLITLNPSNDSYKVIQVSDYLDSKNKSKADDLYNKYTSKLYLDEKELFNTALTQNLIEKGLLSEAKSYILKNEKLNLKKGMISSNYLQALIAVRENKLNDALSFIKKADNLTNGNDVNVKSAMINVYDLLNQKDDAIAESIKIQELNPTPETYIQTVLLAEKYNKDTIANETIEKLKLGLNEEAAKQIDEQLVAILFSNGAFDKAKKYANKMVQNKNYKGYLLLSQIAIYQGNRAEALQNIKLAKEKNVNGASELEKEILKR